MFRALHFYYDGIRNQQFCIAHSFGTSWYGKYKHLNVLMLLWSYIFAFEFFSDCVGSMLPNVKWKLYRLLDHSRIFHVLWKRRQRLRWHGLAMWLFLSLFKFFYSNNFILCKKRRRARALSVHFVVISLDAWIKCRQTVKIPLDRSKRIVFLCDEIYVIRQPTPQLYISVIRTTYIKLINTKNVRLFNLCIIY